MSALPRHPLLLYLLGCVCLLLSSLLLVEHVLALRALTGVTLPLAVQVPPLERRLRILEEQVQAAELQAALTGGAAEEMVRAFTLPTTPEIERIVSFFDVLREGLSVQKLLHHMSPLTIGDSSPIPDTPDLIGTPVSLRLDLSTEGARVALWFLELAGSFSIADAIPADDLALLLRRAEEENPSGIIALEHFLATDLLLYAQEPKPHEEALRRMFADGPFLEEFERILTLSLADVRSILGGRIGQMLEERHLWPLRALVLQDVTYSQLSPDRVHLTLSFLAYSRKE